MKLRNLLTGLILVAATCAAQGAFYLKSGDRVVFYGDSITDQRMYTTFTETFVVTRYPKLDVRFTHSGWGGDRVSGGGGGSIDVRLKRDVFPYNPTVVTIMLGMNDGRYRSYDADIFKEYSTGYEWMLKGIQAGAPGVRITLIRPSPYDEVTREPMKAGSYNAVLIKYGDYLQGLGKTYNMAVADLNAPVVAALEKANAANPTEAQKIVPDRVHPGWSGHLLMAGALLKAWDAQGLVSEVAIDAQSGKVAAATNAQVTGVKSGESAGWTELEGSLPMPIDMADGPTKLAMESSDFIQTLNRETLKVTGLKASHYALKIDGMQVAVFTADQLAAGINLATLPTPMLKQANEVHALTLKRTAVHNTRWRTLQVPFEKDNFAKNTQAMADLDALDEEIMARQREAAQPKAHHFEVMPVPASAASVPPGFQPILDQNDRNGWHVSQVNHHGNTEAWKVKDGVLSGTQDTPGHGGILLTDKKYRNFEVYAEINPDYGCDGGLFLRSTEKGEAYQVLLDYRDEGELMGVYGEALKDVKTWFPPNWREHYKAGEWNAVRARIEGDSPHIQVWLNGARLTDWYDTSNHLPDHAVDGMIAVQVHGGTKIWKQGEYYQRFRNIAVRELP